MANKELAGHLKQAIKKNPRHFVIAANGKNVALALGKREPAQSVAKELLGEVEGGRVYRGVCCSNGKGTLVFQSLDSIPNVVSALKSHIADEAGLQVKPEFAQVQSLDAVDENAPDVDSDGEDDKDDEGDEHDADDKDDAAEKQLAASVRAKKAELADDLKEALAADGPNKDTVVKLTRSASVAEKRGDLAAALHALEQVEKAMATSGAEASSSGATAKASASPGTAVADASSEAEAVRMKNTLSKQIREALGQRPELRTEVTELLRKAEKAEDANDYDAVLDVYEEIEDRIEGDTDAADAALAQQEALQRKDALSKRVREALEQRPELRTEVAAMLRLADAKEKAGDHEAQLEAYERLEGLVDGDTDQEDDEEAAQRLDVKVWKQYRTFLRPRLGKVSRSKGEPEPIFVGRRKVDFDVEGKPWRGHVVLVGNKCRPLAQRLKREGAQLFQATCFVREADWTIVAEGLAGGAAKAAAKTLKRLKLGYKMGADEEQPAQPHTQPQSQPDVGQQQPAPERKGPPPRRVGGGASTGPAKPAKIPPKNSYVSKVFSSGIEPDMFNRPDDMSEPELAGLCKRYNFVLKQGGNHRQAILDEMGIAKTRMTADYDVKNLEAHTRQFWEKLHERWRKDGTLAVDAGTSPVPTLEAIGKTENPDNWVEGKSEDSIKKYRAKTIATARVDLDKPKEAQVKVEALADANEQLRKAGSFIRLEVAGKPDADGFVKVRPVWNMEQAMSKTGAESHEKLVRMNAPRQQGLRPSDEAVKETQFVSWADCHRTAQTIMGSEDTASGIEDREGVVMKGLDEPIRPVPKSRTKEIAGATDHGANRAMHGFFGAAMPKMRQKLVAKQKEGALTKAETELLRQIDAQGQGENLKNFRQAYRTVCDDPDLAREFSAEFGINEAIVPRVGTAFAQINDEMEKSDGEKTGEDLWNFHFAGVVLVNPDGSYMTLENLSVEDSTAVNDNWYFAVYDPKNGKSFHDVNAEDDHVGDHPITLLLDKVPQK